MDHIIHYKTSTPFPNNSDVPAPENSTNPVLRIAFDGTIHYANPAACQKLLAIWDCCVGQKIPAEILSLISVTLYQRKRFEHEIKVGEKYFWLEISPVMDRPQVDIFSREITEWKQTDVKLRRYQLLAEYSRDIILFVRLSDGLILEANQSAVSTYGYSRVELMSMTIFQIRAPEYRGLSLDQMRQAEKAGILFETFHSRKDGSIFPVEVSSIGADFGEDRGLLSVIRDITERKKTEQTIQTKELQIRDHEAHVELQHYLMAQRETERLNIARDIHDTTLQGLLVTNLELTTFAQKVEDLALRDAISLIAQSLQTQISDLQTYLTELRPPILVHFGLIPAIYSHSQQFHKKYPEIQIHLNLEDNLTEISGPVQLALFRIYQEALDNIKKHSRASSVDVHLRRLDGSIEFSITDNGCGFEVPSNLICLARQNKLGLASIQEYASFIHGTVQINSSPEINKTTISVQIPLEI